MTMQERVSQAKQALDALLAKMLEPGAAQEVGLNEEDDEEVEIEISEPLSALLDLQTQCEEAAMAIRMFVAENGVILSD